MSNILIISAVFCPEPVVSAKLSEDLANELVLSHEVSVIAPNPTRPFGFDLQIDREKKTVYKLMNLDSYTCPKSKVFGRLRESYSFGVACKKYISKNVKNIDVIYMNSWPIFSQYLIVKTAKKYKIKVITHVQDVYPESLSNKTPRFSSILNFIFLPIDKFVLKKSDKIIAISNKMRDYLAATRKMDDSKFKVVQNWQNEESFTSYKPKEKIRNGLFTFMYLGNIGPVAGVDLIIDAFSKSDIPSSKLVIAGSGSQKEALQKKVVKSKILNIEFLDVPDGKVPKIQDMADVMLLPIKKGAASSSIPSKLSAYMFSKKPIIASVDLNSDSAKAINEANAGWVIEPENIEVFKKAMKEAFLLDKNELDLKAENGFNYAMNNLSKKNNLQQVVNVILESI